MSEFTSSTRWELPPNQNAALAVADAIKIGYRHIDATATSTAQRHTITKEPWLHESSRV